MKRMNDFLFGLQELDEPDAVKLSEEYPTVPDEKKKQLYKEVGERMKTRHISDDSEITESFEVTEAPKRSSFRSVSVIAACLLLVAGVSGGGIWMIQSMKSEEPISPGQEITFSENEMESATADETAALVLSDELPQDVIISESEPASASIEDTAALEPSDEVVQHDHHFDFTITFDFGDRTKVVDSEMITDWLMMNADGTAKLNGDGDIIFDRSKISLFVAEMAAETDTWGKDRMFHATVDGAITVPWTGDVYSTYGWEIDQTETIEQLIMLLHEGETVTAEPVYRNKGYVRDEDDIGTTYVEADISEQHLWVYNDGVIVFECDFVSGTETDPERRTPRGICQILHKGNNETLGTFASEGYKISVDYWMPFNLWGCGFHDAEREAYGGEIYLSNGTHGCFELSDDDMQTLFDLVEVGMPCIVHD